MGSGNLPIRKPMMQKLVHSLCRSISAFDSEAMFRTSGFLSQRIAARILAKMLVR